MLVLGSQFLKLLIPLFARNLSSLAVLHLTDFMFGEFSWKRVCMLTLLVSLLLEAVLLGYGWTLLLNA
jgi:hypothetical protein